MDPANFKSSEFGTTKVDTREGFTWYDPKPLPRSLPLSDETVVALSLADAAVGRLDGVAQLLPNTELVATPYAAREAIASSRLEGTHTTLEEMYEAEAGKYVISAEDILKITNYRKALHLGMASVANGSLTLGLLKKIHATLMEGEQLEGPLGEWRKKPAWVSSPNNSPITAPFVPPIQGRLTVAMKNWQAWQGNQPRLPALINIALLHFQFLSIHPFADGNGRVSRIIIQLMLSKSGLLSEPLLYVSPYFADRRREYFDRLQAVRERGEMQQWLQFFLKAVEVQATDGIKRARAILDLRNRYHDELAKSRSRAIEVVDILFEQPILTSQIVEENLGISKSGALNLIRGLESRGILIRGAAAGRGGTKYWSSKEVLEILDP